MFQFPRLPPPDLCVQSGVTTYDRCRVAPFGNPRISLLGSSPWLIAAIPRPSSAQSAKASTVRRSRLTYFTVPACTSFSDRPSVGGSSESVGERSSNTLRARDPRARAWTLNTTIHNSKVPQCANGLVSKTAEGSMGTRKKPKERAGGCQALRSVMCSVRRSGCCGSRCCGSRLGRGPAHGLRGIRKPEESCSVARWGWPDLPVLVLKGWRRSGTSRHAN